MQIQPRVLTVLLGGHVSVMLYHAVATAKPFVRLSPTPAEINSALSCV